MLFTLEALRAEAGDSLLLLYGRPERPRVIVIDGGPTKAVYKRLKARLDDLRERTGLKDRGKPLPIELLMVSHIDDDHIDGILHLTRQLLGEGNDKSYDVKSVWHNSFDDLIGNDADELRTAAVGDVEAASTGGDFFDQDLVEHDTALILASVNQGRELRDNVKLLMGDVPPLIVAEEDERPKNFGQGLKLRVVGPLFPQLKKLQDEWKKHLEKLRREGKLDEAEAASFTDSSAANLASIVVLAEAKSNGKTKTMLLTGDARADFLHDSLEARKLLDDDGRLHVDLFKLPHHGSNRNVERSTFRAVTADHYVISGDGHHGNPDVDTLEMLFGGREDAGVLDEPFTIHVTYDPAEFRPYKGKDYPLDKLQETLDAARQAGHDFELKHPPIPQDGDDEEHVRIDLLDPSEV